MEILEPTIRKRLFFYCLFIFLWHTSSPSFSSDLAFSFKEKDTYFDFLVTNNLEQEIVAPSFKRCCPVIFLVFSTTGKLFPGKDWQLIPERNFAHGIRRDFAPKSKNQPQIIYEFYKDLRQFNLDPENTGQKVQDGVFFMVGYVNQSWNAAIPPCQTGFYVLELTKGQIANLKETTRESIPKAVLTGMQKEYDKILAEEKSGKFGYP